ncbi:hypothetical protein [uncultured Microbacterium sp.]|uniref:hypothetical protein n=1 Tax=uncultured Microbacterium sp. TaxID=191216 RepID=UPI0025DB4B32|nr:hypothetical protein [uncultured Microbacterium sp.]
MTAPHEWRLARCVRCGREVDDAERCRSCGLTDPADGASGVWLPANEAGLGRRATLGEAHGL